MTRAARELLGPPLPDPAALREAESVVEQLEDLSGRRIEAAVVSPCGNPQIQLRDPRTYPNPLQDQLGIRPGRLTTLDVARVRALYHLED